MIVRKLILGLLLAAQVNPVMARPLSTRATYYSNYYVGRRMANGKRFFQNSNYVATNSYRLGTKLRICYKGRCIIGVVSDRCNCSLDLSQGLFRQLSPLNKGRINVQIQRY